MDRKLQRHRADSLRQHGFLVLSRCQDIMHISTYRCVILLSDHRVGSKSFNFVLSWPDHKSYYVRTMY